MRPRPLTRRQAALGAAMLAALALAWRETRSPATLSPGPGRAGTGRGLHASPALGGHAASHTAASDARTSASTPEEALRDAPAARESFTPMSVMPRLPPRAAGAQKAPTSGVTAAAPSATASGSSGVRDRLGTPGPAPSYGRRPRRPSSPRYDAPLARPSSAPIAPQKRSTTLDPAVSAAAPARASPPPRSAATTRSPASRPAALARAAAGRFSLFSPTPAARERSRRESARKPPRVRPPRFDRALGPGAVRPPGDVVEPTLAELGARQPLAGPDGGPARWTEAPLPRLEATDPDAEALDCRKRDGHWHAEAERRVYHAGGGRGLAFGDAWLWLSRLERRWWALPDAARAPWLRHRDHWWARAEGVWFVLHEGESWAWRHFARWEADGLIHPGTGTVIVYSADLSRAAVLTPGEGAVLFDADSGVELGRWSEHELPPRWRLPPETLSLPRGI